MGGHRDSPFLIAFIPSRRDDCLRTGWQTGMCDVQRKRRRRNLHTRQEPSLRSGLGPGESAKTLATVEPIEVLRFLVGPLQVE